MRSTMTDPLAKPIFSTTPRAAEGSTPTPERPRPAGRNKVSTSLALVVADLTPHEAAALVAEAEGTLPSTARHEILVLDDHTNPQRRDLVQALEGCGDAMRLVPRPSGGAAVEIDALAISCGSEFLVVPMGAEPPLAALEPLLELMWARGSDSGVVLADAGSAAICADQDTASQFTTYAGLTSTGGKLGGTDPGRLGSRVLVVRRWVARWVFSETERALDTADEVADRARLLGLEMDTVDSAGLLVT